jgi:hypothetical protein
MSTIKDLKVGDPAVRYLGGVLPMPVIVEFIEDGFIYVKSRDGIIHGKDMDWKFNPETGGEVDEALEWDGVTHTGSILKLE